MIQIDLLNVMIVHLKMGQIVLLKIIGLFSGFGERILYLGGFGGNILSRIFRVANKWMHWGVNHLICTATEGAELGQRLREPQRCIHA